MSSQKKIESCRNIIKEGIRVLSEDYSKEDRDGKKTILLDVAVKFGMVSEVFYNLSKGIDPQIFEEFSEFARLLQNAWNEF